MTSSTRPDLRCNDDGGKQIEVCMKIYRIVEQIYMTLHAVFAPPYNKATPWYGWVRSHRHSMLGRSMLVRMRWMACGALDLWSIELLQDFSRDSPMQYRNIFCSTLFLPIRYILDPYHILLKCLDYGQAWLGNCRWFGCRGPRHRDGKLSDRVSDFRRASDIDNWLILVRCSKLRDLWFLSARRCKLGKVLAPSRDHAAPGGWGLVKGMGTGLVGGAAIAVTGTVCGPAFTCCLCSEVCLLVVLCFRVWWVASHYQDI